VAFAGIGEREPHHGGVVLIDMNVKLMLLSFGCRSRLGGQTADDSGPDHVDQAHSLVPDLVAFLSRR
jgi:hypothetical protein